MRKYILILITVVLFMAGCAEKAKGPVLKSWTEPVQDLPEPTGGFVMRVADQTVTCEQIIGPSLEHLVPSRRRPVSSSSSIQARPAVEQIFAINVANILLVQQAKKKAGDNIDEQLNKLADAEVKKFIMTYKGDAAKAEEALKNMGMDWNSFKEYHKKMMLAQSYIQSQLPENIPIAYHEMLDYYNSTKDRFFTSAGLHTVPAHRYRRDENRRQRPQRRQASKSSGACQPVVEQLHNDANFAELAAKYSSDHRSQFGGLWKPVSPMPSRRPMMCSPNNPKTMQPGQIAGPIDAGEHIFIMKLEDKKVASVEPFDKVQERD